MQLCDSCMKQPDPSRDKVCGQETAYTDNRGLAFLNELVYCTQKPLREKPLT